MRAVGVGVGGRTLGRASVDRRTMLEVLLAPEGMRLSASWDDEEDLRRGQAAAAAAAAAARDMAAASLGSVEVLGS